MSFFKPVGKAAKFALVTVPLSIFGWQLNKRLFQWIQSIWTQSVNPPCPSCDGGVLFVRQDVAPVYEEKEDNKLPHELYPWVCSKCGYALLETLDVKHVRETANRHRQENAKAAFSEMEWNEREQIARKHRIGSRIFFLGSLLTFGNGMYMLASGTSFLLIANWLSFAFMFWVIGMKRSYRAWQVISGHIFESGAFGHWLKHGKWLV